MKRRTECPFCGARWLLCEPRHGPWCCDRIARAHDVPRPSAKERERRLDREWFYAYRDGRYAANNRRGLTWPYTLSAHRLRDGFALLNGTAP